MNLSREKVNIFNRIRLLTSLRDAPQPEESLRINERDGDPVDFMISLLLTLSGVDKLRDTFTRLTLSSLSGLDQAVRQAIINQSGYGGASNLVMEFSFTLPIRVIDPHGRYRSALSFPNSFDDGLYRAINNTDPVTFHGITVTNLDGENIRVENAVTSSELSAFNRQYFPDNLGAMIEPKNLVERAFNDLFGHKDATTQNSFAVSHQLRLDRAIEKVIYEQQNPFSLSQQEEKQVREEAQRRAAGQWELDLICGKNTVTVPQGALETLYSTLDGQSYQDVQNALDQVFEGSINGSPVLEAQPDAAREGFFRRLLLGLVKAVLSQSVSSSQVRLYLLILDQVRGQQIVVTESIELLKRNEALIRCILKAAMEAFVEAMIPVVEEEAKKIVIPAFRKIVRQMASKRIEQLKSLVS